MNYLLRPCAFVSCVLVSGFIASSATAAVAVFQQQSAWTFSVENGILMPGNTPNQIVSENFNSYSGAYANGLTGNAGPVQWTAGAVNFNSGPSSLIANSSWLSTAAPDQGLKFDFSPGVFAVGGNFFSRDSGFNVVPALIGVFFADGTSSVQYVSTDNSFSGFISSVAISQLMVQVYPSTAGVNFATVDNLYFGVVPAPGAAALLGLAALVCRRRR
jgi:hypothetical protein